MDAENPRDRAMAASSKPSPAARQTFTRRIDCAPGPRRPDPGPAHPGHGYGRAPGEDA